MQGRASACVWVKQDSFKQQTDIFFGSHWEDAETVVIYMLSNNIHPSWCTASNGRVHAPCRLEQINQMTATHVHPLLAARCVPRLYTCRSRTEAPPMWHFRTPERSRKGIALRSGSPKAFCCSWRELVVQQRLFHGRLRSSPLAVAVPCARIQPWVD